VRTTVKFLSAEILGGDGELSERKANEVEKLSVMLIAGVIENTSGALVEISPCICAQRRTTGAVFKILPVANYRPVAGLAERANAGID